MNSYKTKILMVLYLAVTQWIPVKCQESPITIDANFTGDYVRNLHGGLKRGFTSLGLFNLAAGFDTEKAHLWKGGKFFMHVHNFVGNHPSEKIIGDVQVASNIDGYCHSFLYEAYYEQSFKDISLLGGFHNLNNAFYASAYAGNFLNSSFGISPSLSFNNPISIFPATTLGGLLKYEKKAFSFLAGFYNLDHHLTDEKGFDLKHQFFQQGFYAITETQFRTGENKLSGEYKMGGCYRKCNVLHAHQSEDCDVKNNYSFYVLADQSVYQFRPGKEIGVFIQTGYSPQKWNSSPLYIAGGMNMKGFLTRKGKDIIGIAVASAQINQFSEISYLFEYYDYESVVELMAKFPVTTNINVQPDLQYIIHPCGGPGISNAFVGILRTELNF
jgi:porin